MPLLVGSPGIWRLAWTWVGRHGRGTRALGEGAEPTAGDEGRQETEQLQEQDVVAGDGTTSVVVICGALLKKCQELLEKGVHPTIISDAFSKAANKACKAAAHTHDGPGCSGVGTILAPVRSVSAPAYPGIERDKAKGCRAGSTSERDILESIAIPVDMDDRESLIRAANT
ncbi:T-complex protein 1 subunit delta [Tetrabaena socialis]|uniref:T-complex protein 1 subunit delta n=1 Tax=Tetrabaena socialis TaxID=47790 RepID=A0A2J7ZQR8_9CHLO|nr:T-complex protein 1 subunit delta [Tetrabaena socialis]|eukprot:PNH02600.1 T-complex protein 1 subunit delta [Tetrabaena socialis]